MHYFYHNINKYKYINLLFIYLFIFTMIRVLLYFQAGLYMFDLLFLLLFILCIYKKLKNIKNIG